MPSKMAQIQRSASGGSELWVCGEPKDGDCWAEGWHSPNPIAWWATKAEDWRLIGHKLMVVDTKMTKDWFFVHRKLDGTNDYIGSDGTTQLMGNARLSSDGNYEGGKGPFLIKLPDDGKGPKADHPTKKQKFTSPPEEPKQTRGEPEQKFTSPPEETKQGLELMSDLERSSEIKPEQPAGPPPDYLLTKEVAPQSSTPPQLQPSTPLVVQPSTPIGIRQPSYAYWDPKYSHAIGVRPPPVIGEYCPPTSKAMAIGRASKAT